MEDIFIECSPGIWRYVVRAFYDLGVPKEVIEKPLIDLGLKDLYNLEFEESKVVQSVDQDKKKILIVPQ